MAEEPRVGDLELREEPALQRRLWRIERASWIGLSIVLLLALLGAFGDGPLSDARARAPGDALRLEYERITRHMVPTRLAFSLPVGAVEGGHVQVWLENDYLSAHRLATVMPAPVRVEAGPERTRFVFKVADASRSVRLTFVLEPTGYGWQRARAGTPRAALDFGSFVLP